MLSIDTAVERPSSVESDARRAVAEMLANGARFTITRRDNGRPDFLWELPDGGNRSACRKIISEAKQNSAAYWDAFVAAIVEHAGGPAR
ncbi:MAG: hypothetical protein WBD95_01970 [Xanthobacteraceae bacterium]